MCIMNNIPPVEFGNEEEDHNIEIDYGMYNDAIVHEVRPVRNRDLLAGRRLQQLIIRNHFTN